MKTKGRRNWSAEYPKMLLIAEELTVVTQDVCEKKGG
jgi:hypothetical protein